MHVPIHVHMLKIKKEGKKEKSTKKSFSKPSYKINVYKIHRYMCIRKSVVGFSECQPSLWIVFKQFIYVLL